jgi:hypothetical protein
MLAIELGNFNIGLDEMEIVQAMNVDADNIRRSSGVAVGVDAAVFAEPVLGNPGTGLVERECLLPGMQPEAFRRDAMMQSAFPGADRAVAFNRLDIFS